MSIDGIRIDVSLEHQSTLPQALVSFIDEEQILHRDPFDPWLTIDCRPLLLARLLINSRRPTRTSNATVSSSSRGVLLQLLMPACPEHRL